MKFTDRATNAKIQEVYKLEKIKYCQLNLYEFLISLYSKDGRKYFYICEML